MSHTLSVTELVRHFADYVNRVVYRGERFQLARGGKPVAELRPLASGRSLADLPDLVSGPPSLSEKEASAFSADLDRARIELPRVTSQGCLDPPGFFRIHRSTIVRLDRVEPSSRCRRRTRAAVT